MRHGKPVFAQLMEHLPPHAFRRCVASYPGRYPTLEFSHLDQFLCVAFAQQSFRELGLPKSYSGEPRRNMSA